jgi:hypothetical protein
MAAQRLRRNKANFPGRASRCRLFDLARGREHGRQTPPPTRGAEGRRKQLMHGPGVVEWLWARQVGRCSWAR